MVKHKGPFNIFKRFEILNSWFYISCSVYDIHAHEFMLNTKQFLSSSNERKIDYGNYIAVAKCIFPSIKLEMNC